MKAFISHSPSDEIGGELGEGAVLIEPEGQPQVSFLKVSQAVWDLGQQVLAA